MANVLRGGFHPIDGIRFKPQKYTCVSAYAPSNSNIGVARGEVVTLKTTGVLEIAEAGDADLILGVVQSVTYKGTDGSTVYGSYLPTGYTYTGDPNVSNPNAPIIEVIVDPDMQWFGCVVTGSTSALVYAGLGANMDLSATSSTTTSSVYRESLRTLDASFIAGTAQFRIDDVIKDALNDVTLASYRVKCTINEGFHVFHSQAGI
jgi:hypothetical protein